jgi:GTP cyclohydrolase I
VLKDLRGLPALWRGVEVVDEARVARAVREILAAIGDDPDREGLRETPERVAEAYAQLFSGLYEDPTSFLQATFDEGARDLVLVRDLPVASMCEHHMLPWTGKAHVGVRADGKVAGFLGAGARRRRIRQEAATAGAADRPGRGRRARRFGRGRAIVVVEAVHTCMTMRNAETTGSVAVTSAARGVFADDPARRAEVLALIRDAR